MEHHPYFLWVVLPSVVCYVLFMTVREWLASYGWTGISAEMLLAASVGLAGVCMDDPAPAFACRPGERRRVLRLEDVLRMNKSS